MCIYIYRTLRERERGVYLNHKESPAKRHQIGHCSQRDAAFQPPQCESFGTSEELELSKAEGALEAQWSNQLEMKYVCVYIYICDYTFCLRA